MPEPYDSLKPPQIAVTVRSLPRRVGEALAALEMAEVELDAAGPDGRSPLELVDDIGRSLMVIDRGLEQTLLHDTPTILAAVMDPAQRDWHESPPDRATSMAALDDIATELADRIDGADADAWYRTASVAGGGRVTALDIAREAARSGVTRLRQLEAMAEA